jgi:hypothetical protein
MRKKTAILPCVFACFLLPSLLVAQVQSSATAVPETKPAGKEQPAQAAASKSAIALKTVEGTSPINITARLGDDSTFTGRVWITAGAAVPKLLIRAGDMARDTPQGKIVSSQISLVPPSEIELAAGVQKSIDVKFAGVKEPGVYTGTIYLSEPGKDATSAFTVPIYLIVHADPVLNPCKGSESLNLRFVQCSYVGCWVAGVMEPNAVLASQLNSTVASRFVCLENNSLESFSLESAFQDRGTAANIIPDDAFLVDTAKTNPVQPGPSFVQVPVAFSKAPAADHYIGSINFKSGHKPLAVVPLDVTVQSGPMFPLLVLFIGVVVGRLLKYLQDKGIPQSDLLVELYQFEGQTAVSPPDQSLLLPMFEDLRAEIYEMQLDQAKTDLAAIQSRWKLLCTLRRLERILTPHQADTGVQPILDNIQSARQLIAASQDAQAATAVASIQAAVASLNFQQAAQTKVSGFIAKSWANRANLIASQNALPAQTGGLPRWAKFVGNLLGVKCVFQAELILWLVRPAVYVLLIVALCLTGMRLLYVNNPTFGSSLFSDYFALFVWAISADTASRTLSNLKSGS